MQKKHIEKKREWRKYIFNQTEELHIGEMVCIRSMNYGIYERIHNFVAINFAFLRNFFIIFF